jgi:hypothetical protein
MSVSGSGGAISSTTGRTEKPLLRVSTFNGSTLPLEKLRL